MGDRDKVFNPLGYGKVRIGKGRVIMLMNRLLRLLLNLSLLRFECYKQTLEVSRWSFAASPGVFESADLKWN